MALSFFWTNGLKLKKKLNFFFFLWLSAAKVGNHFPIKVMNALFWSPLGVDRGKLGTIQSRNPCSDRGSITLFLALISASF